MRGPKPMAFMYEGSARPMCGRGVSGANQIYAQGLKQYRVEKLGSLHTVFGFIQSLSREN